MYMGRRWSLASKSARLIGIPNELQLEILSYLPSRDLLAIVTTSKQFLEIIACILTQCGSMWYLPGCLDINVETYRAAKLWLSSNQGRDLTFIVRLAFTVRHQEDLKSSIQFLSCITAGHTPCLFTTLFLNFFPCRVSELDRSSLELFFSLIHQLASPTIHIYSMMRPDHRPSLPLFAVPSLPLVHDLEVLDCGSFLCDAMIISSSNLRSLRLCLSSRRPEEWEFLTDLRLDNLSQVWLEIAIPAHVVRAIIKHHASLRHLNTIRATIVHDDGDSRYSLQGHKSGIQHLPTCPDLVSMLKVLTFTDIRYVQLVLSVETSLSPSVFLQSMFPASFPPETAVHLALPLPQKFDYQALYETTPPQVAFIKQLYLELEAFKTVKDILDALSSCVPFIKGHTLTLQMYGLEKNALDQILLAIHTSVFPDYLLVIVVGRTRDKKVLRGGVNTRIGRVAYCTVSDSLTDI
ncbi:uncharacterized protein EV420DRAFT_1478207 [Desarmillaria tabescens]|uniref:F-box domain-containing protein n=1 Tax=Armillaria tabescens TaxID=1929756 RepID=A0AA39KJ68_ARMTA|nr:uncharacterized protein EV420DRAFT_1478207 [Desarmillaria tabescens]KAK0460423.1 hypothetical protein EV420DRAFT_1478207 [Desarmillaria tabescens]